MLTRGTRGLKSSAHSDNLTRLLRHSFFPLLIYYATTLGIPLANGAFGQGTDFREHSVFVLLTPLVQLLPFAAFRLYRYQRADSGARSLGPVP